jgi:diaminopimelate decarboxylase
MKSCPNAAILKVFHSMGIHIDASSGYEVQRAMRAGIPAAHISLSSQELPNNFAEFLDAGVHINACSLSQIERIGASRPKARIGLRINPGLGSGDHMKKNVGGPMSSFGIWHTLMGKAKAIVSRYSLTVIKIHTHIGSGSDPAVWQRVSSLSLQLCQQFDTVDTLNLGGGYKVARVEGEKETCFNQIGPPVQVNFERFQAETGRCLKLEIEPGNALVANAGCLICRAQDIVETDASESDGASEAVHRFIKIDGGMTEILRPSLYGAQHSITVVKQHHQGDGGQGDCSTKDFVVVGHCCESGDLLTPAPDDPTNEGIGKRALREDTVVGDLLVVGGTGAYCSSMSAKNYNSFPEAAEVLAMANGGLELIRKRQTLEQLIENEVDFVA